MGALVRRSSTQYVMVLVLAGTLAIGGVRPALAEQLPTLGGAGGGLLSSQQEAAIAEHVMRSLRKTMPVLRDPLLEDYLSSVVYNLVPHVQLNNRDLTLVILDDPAINAFAVPGGIIGVNAGLFLHAETEQQFVSVMAHELAHLSQRHFARRMEQQERAAPMALAGMVAGIILSAVTRSDIGLAAIAGSQALAIQNMLQYSRLNEQEADRVGLEIMAKAGYDPDAMPRMFGQMLRRARLQGDRPPEYLSTHPLTESRVSDTQNRAAQYPKGSRGDSLEYHLMRARALVKYAQSASDAVKTFEEQLEKPGSEKNAALRYGLAIALQADNRAEEAIGILQGLLEDHPGHISLVVTLASAELTLDKFEQAADRLEQALRRSPGNVPLQSKLAEVRMAQNRPEAAARLYEKLTRNDPQNSQIWQRLADAQVESRNIVEVHRARAEYELLMSNPERAEMHLREAINRAQGNLQVQEALRNRLQEVLARIDQSGER
ncbi:M48 family metalloprotease [Hydrocarboniclastica marina]|uniref:Putative beta-barrel assembly-enhancing protease n=1 Tax=Hydrocarboniclastica marina TaxID=2259620 RepID=A0A4P7XH96_9ALTE|nr:M48 family metalloprotease [Hydrocarboniclastica marina]QCF25824.1 M48 family peptidase [Hydrocarboniclastica marina]